MKKFITIILPCVLCSAVSLAQFNPVNPPNPGSVYKITGKSVPEGIIPTVVKECFVGQECYLSCSFFDSGHPDSYTLDKWIDDDGNEISEYPYIMPAHDVVVTAHFSFKGKPDMPGTNPYNDVTGQQIMDYFEPGSLMNSIPTRSDKVFSLMVAGPILDNDFSLGDLSYTYSVDYSRTSGGKNVPPSAFTVAANTLNGVTLPSSVETIGEMAFCNCHALIALNMFAQIPPQVDATAFEGVSEDLVIYVPSTSVSAYQNAPVWKDYKIKAMSGVPSLQVNFPPERPSGLYKGCTLELTNTASGERLYYIVDDRPVYVFHYLPTSTSWTARLIDEEGYVVAYNYNIDIRFSDKEVTLGNFSEKQLVSVTVYDPDYNDVTGMFSPVSLYFTWATADNPMAYRGDSIFCYPGTELTLNIKLPLVLSDYCKAPASEKCTVSEYGNQICVYLSQTEKLTLKGKVLDDATGYPLSGAKVVAEQTVSKDYTRSLSAMTDEEGLYELEIFNTKVDAMNIYLDGYEPVSLMPDEDGFCNGAEIDMGTSRLKQIVPLQLSLNCALQRAVKDGETAQLDDFSDYSDLVLSPYNLTSGKPVRNFRFDKGNITILESIGFGDSLRLTIASISGAFESIVVETALNSVYNNVSCIFKENGTLTVKVASTENSGLAFLLFDDKGSLERKVVTDNAECSMEKLPSGTYTLAVMGRDDRYNSFNRLSQIAESGFKEGRDYVWCTMEAETGKNNVKAIPMVPLLNINESFLDDASYFNYGGTALKIGDYATLYSNVVFRKEVRDKVSDIALMIDVDERLPYVEGSAMMAPKGAGSGDIIKNVTNSGGRVSIPVGNNSYESYLMRCCVRSVTEGSYTVTAYVRFLYGGREYVKPLGNVTVDVASAFTMNVPSETKFPEFSVSGEIQKSQVSAATIEIYEGTNLIGKTKPAGNGFWTAECKLDNPYNLTEYSIYAKLVIDGEAVEQSATSTIKYNVNSNGVRKVQMFVFDGISEQIMTFDYEHFTKPAPITCNTDIVGENGVSFTIDFQANDTTLVKDVRLFVSRNAGYEWTELEPFWSERKKCWMASYDGTHVAGSYTVAVYSIDCSPVYYDSQKISGYQSKEAILKNFPEVDAQMKTIQNAADDLFAYIENGGTDNNVIDEKYAYLMSLYNLDYDRPWTPTETEEEFSERLEREAAGYKDTSLDMGKTLDWDDLKKAEEYLNGMKAEETGSIDAAMLIMQGYVSMVTTNGMRVFGKTTDTECSLIFEETGIKLTIPRNGDAMKAPTYGAPAVGTALAEAIGAFNDAYNDLRGYMETMLTSLGTMLDEMAENEETLSKDLERAKECLKNAGSGTEKLKWLAKCKYAQMALKTAVKVGKAVLSSLSNLGLAVIKNAGSAAKVVPVVSAGSAFYGVTQACFDGALVLGDWRAWIILLQAGMAHCELGNDLRQAYIDDLEAELRVFMLYYASTFVTDLASLVTAGVSLMGAPASAGASLVGVAVAVAALTAPKVANEYFDIDIEKEIKSRRGNFNYIMNKIPCVKKRGKKNPDPDPVPDNPYPHPGAVIFDPSGYVYEAVTDNRVEGAKALLWYKDAVADETGNVTYTEPVVWDAEEFAQENPLFTDAEGKYRWDVPEGLWQVRVSKKNYAETRSEWLPVPPPQLDVNLPLVSYVSPAVTRATAYTDGVEVAFSKYMDIESFMPAGEGVPPRVTISVVRGDSNVFVKDVTVVPLDAKRVSEADSTVYATQFLIGSSELEGVDEALVTVSAAVKSYSGTEMGVNWSQSLDVHRRVEALIVDSVVYVPFEGVKTITVAAMPANLVQGRQLVVASLAGDVVGVCAGSQIVDFDSDGYAQFAVSGEMLGLCRLTLSVSGTSFSRDIMVKVMQSGLLGQSVAAPKASRLSGTAVYRGQAVELSCETEQATILYTLDGTCPCESTSALRYDGKPIVINAPVTVKAMAVGLDGTESEVSEFEYSIRTVTQSIDFAQGYTWASHSVADEIDTQMFAQYARSIETSNGVWEAPAPASSSSSLSSSSSGSGFMISPSEMFRVRSEVSVSVGFEGDEYNPAAQYISLKEGRNWLGYPLQQVMTPAEAFGNLEAEDGDCISGQDGFAVYSDGVWTGSLETMRPGQGYFYWSQGPKSLVYNTDIVSDAVSRYGHGLDKSASSGWTADKHKYPETMNIVAKLLVEDVAVDASEYEIAAFDGDECRGTGRVIDGNVWLTVYGSTWQRTTSELILKVMRLEDGTVSEANEKPSFDPGLQGSPKSPCIISVGTHVSLEETGLDEDNDTWYDLLGRRLNNEPTAQGLYIQGHHLIRK